MVRLIRFIVIAGMITSSIAAMEVTEKVTENESASDKDEGMEKIRIVDCNQDAYKKYIDAKTSTLYIKNGTFPLYRAFQALKEKGLTINDLDHENATSICQDTLTRELRKVALDEIIENFCALVKKEEQFRVVHIVVPTYSYMAWGCVSGEKEYNQLVAKILKAQANYYCERYQRITPEYSLWPHGEIIIVIPQLIWFKSYFSLCKKRQNYKKSFIEKKGNRIVQKKNQAINKTLKAIGVSKNICVVRPVPTIGRKSVQRLPTQKTPASITL